MAFIIEQATHRIHQTAGFLTRVTGVRLALALRLRKISSNHREIPCHPLAVYCDAMY